MLMAARPATVGALDLLKLALELAEAGDQGISPELRSYVHELLTSANRLVESQAPSHQIEPDVIQLALAIATDPEVKEALRQVSSLEDISPSVAKELKSKMGMEVAA